MMLLTIVMREGAIALAWYNDSVTILLKGKHLDKKAFTVSALLHVKEKEHTQSKGTTSAIVGTPTEKARKRNVFATIWFWLALVLVIGIIMVGVMTSLANAWVKSVKLPSATQSLPTPPISTLTVGRTAPYAGLDITVVKAAYATSFADDTVHAGPAVVRLFLQVANHTNMQINVVYYEVAHLLIPHVKPLAPTNVFLSVGPAPGHDENGWLDFSVPGKLSLETLTLQLGSISLGESLVKIPLAGPFNASIYAAHTTQQRLVIAYNFSGHTLNYSLTSVNVLFAYQGMQCKAGQQLYVLNFLVDNPESGDISPGFGFDYVRLVVNGTDRAPIDNSLPYTFKANAKRVGGHVVFAAPAHLKQLTIGFLSQNGNGEQDTTINV